MSVRVMSLVFQDTSLPQREKMLMLVLADHATDDGGSIYPSVATMAQKASASDRTVQRTLKRLMADGYLKEIVPASRYRPTEYSIQVHRLAGGHNTRGDNVTPLIRGDARVTPGVTSTTARGDTRVVSGVTPVSPDPSLNHRRTTKEPSLVPEPSTALEPVATTIVVERGETTGFMAFYSTYPKKRHRPDAFKAWKSVEGERHFVAIMTGLEAWKHSAEWAREDGRFVPLPGSWLRAHGWQDEPHVTLPAGQSGSPRKGIASLLNEIQERERARG